MTLSSADRRLVMGGQTSFELAQTTATPEDLQSITTSIEDVTVPSCLYPGATFVIRHPPSGKVVELFEGKVRLVTPSGQGSVLWECKQHLGWLGFRNPSSGRFLGRDWGGKISCFQTSQSKWENFVAQIVPDGTFILRQEHGGVLYPIVRAGGGGEDYYLAKIIDINVEGCPLEFRRVERTIADRFFNQAIQSQRESVEDNVH